MAEFGIKATELTPPQGAGATPASPVQRQVISPDWTRGALQIGNMAVQGLLENEQRKAERDSQGVVNAFTQQLARLGDAALQGVSPSEINTRRMALFNSYSAQHPSLVEEFSKVAGWSRDQGGLSHAETVAKERQDIFKMQVNEAISRGIYFSPDDDEETKFRKIQLGQTLAATEHDVDRLIKENAEKRASTNFTQDQQERANKHIGREITNTLIPSTLEKLTLRRNDLQKQLEKGEISFQQAQALFREELVGIRASSSVIGQLDPKSQQSINDILQYAEETFLDSIDPSKTLEEQNVAIGLMETGALRAIYNNSEILTISQLTKAMQFMPEHVKLGWTIDFQDVLFRTMASQSPTGTPDDSRPLNFKNKVEVDSFYSSLKDSVKTGGLEEREVNQLLSNQANNGLLQLQTVAQGTSVDFTNYDAALDFLASPEYLQMKKKGLITPDAEEAAVDFLNIDYNKRFQGPINNMMGQPVPRTFLEGLGNVAVGLASEGGSMDSAEERAYKENMTYGDFLTIQFDGGNVRFSARDPRFRTRRESAIRDFVDQLNSSSALVNRTLRANANLAGQSVTEFWNENRHKLVPAYFPDPEVIKQAEASGLIYDDKYPYTDEENAWKPQ